MSQTADKTPLKQQLVDLVGQLLHQKTGPYTRELIQSPGGFGLGQLPVVNKPDATTTMVCGYCSTGCGLKIHLKEGVAQSLSPKTQYPVNLGMACPKGWEALEVTKADDRATTPLSRDAQGQLQPVDWTKAMEQFCSEVKAVQQKYGPDSVAFLSTGQIPTEEMAFLGALTKFGMGILHGDGNTRQCMATAATAYKQSFGFDSPPFTYKDFEESDVLVFVGANPCIAHPIMWERVMRNPHSPEIVVVDPRTTETASQSTQHLAIAPKSDLTLFYGIARELIQRDCLDHKLIEASTVGFEEFKAHVESFTLEKVVEVTRLPLETIEKLIDTIANGKRVSFWWTMGVNQSYEGTRTAQSLINLAVMTGNIGRPGTGANSITGQCNAMGSRIFSNTTWMMGGYNFDNEQHREKVAGILDIPVENIPQTNSLAYNEIVDGIEAGTIKALWVIATNPAHSWINQNRLNKLRENLDFLVVQDMYHTTETAQMADLVLPSAGWGEKEGTFINSERRIGVIKKVAKAPGQALSDFNIFRLIAHHWGCGNLFEKWTSPAAAFEYIKELSKGQPCDITGIESYQQIDEQGGIQWPCREEHVGENGAVETERRLFADGKFYHADGKMKFLFEDSRPMPEGPSEDFPYVLLTGRGSASQWHTQTRTSKSAVLRKLYPQEVYGEIHPTDAKQLGIGPDGMMTVSSARGEITVKAFVTQSVKPGEVFIPMHYEQTNQLTHDSFDPYSKQPSYKACAVNLKPASWG